jgi:hypothetical protein
MLAAGKADRREAKLSATTSKSNTKHGVAKAELSKKAASLALITQSFLQKWPTYQNGGQGYKTVQRTSHMKEHTPSAARTLDVVA